MTPHEEKAYYARLMRAMNAAEEIDRLEAWYARPSPKGASKMWPYVVGGITVIILFATLTILFLKGASVR